MAIIASKQPAYSDSRILTLVNLRLFLTVAQVRLFSAQLLGKSDFTLAVRTLNFGHAISKQTFAAIALEKTFLAYPFIHKIWCVS